MALPASLIWEVRPTNGTADAGGGFDPSVASPGTDFSQQNAVQKAYTDLVIDAVTNTDITSVSRPFSSVDIGNNIAIVSGTGFTVGIYNIRSIQSGIKARLDRAVGTTGSTGGNGNLGGARSGFSVGTTPIQGVMVAGNTSYVKNEAWNEAVTLSVAGAGGSPVQVIGYNTARGDITLATGRANNPTNNRASAAGDAISITGSNNRIMNITCREAGDDGFAFSGGIFAQFINCRATANGGAGFSAESSLPNVMAIGCEADNNGAQGWLNTLNTTYAFGNYFHDNASNGISVLGGTLVNNVIESNSASGINSTANAVHSWGCTVYGNSGASSDGWTMTTPGIHSMCMNNIFSSNGRDGVRATNGNSVFVDYNDFYNNSGTARTNFPTGPSGQTLDPQFVDAPNGDFGIGTNLQGLGFPGAFS